MSLLYELSTLDPICERIGAIYGAILLLVGMASSKSENGVAVEKAENTLKNLETYETNVKQMAENGRLQPLLTKLIEGMLYMQWSYLVANQSASSFSNTTLQFAKRITRLLLQAHLKFRSPWLNTLVSLRWRTT